MCAAASVSRNGPAGFLRRRSIPARIIPPPRRGKHLAHERAAERLTQGRGPDVEFGGGVVVTGHGLSAGDGTFTPVRRLP